MDYSRPLINNELVLPFATGVLGIKNRQELRDAVNKITDAEMQLSHIKNNSTIESSSYRDIFYKKDSDRQMLYEQIFEELIAKKRIENDDEIELGKGGALPNTTPKSEKQAIFLTGLPASGKSTIASKIADEYGAVILDSDYAKRKFPEYNRNFGASLVHEESSIIIFGDKNKRIDFCVKEYCISEEYNVIIPKIGNDKDSILSLASYFADYGYDIHLVLVSLDRVESTRRAFNRFMSTNRYVPLSLIFDMYSNEPILTYYRSKENKLYKSYAKVSTINRNPEIVECSPNSPINKINLT